MLKIQSLIKKNNKIIRFSIVGAICFLTGTLILYIGTEFFGLHYLISNSIGFIITSLLGWYLNRRFTFKSKNESLLIEYLKYFSTTITSMIITLLIMFILVSILNIQYILANIVLSITMMFINFIAHKNWSFKP